MIEPKEYKVKDNVSKTRLKNSNFVERIAYYVIRQSLYENNLIKLILMIDKEDNYMVINVTDDNGNTYAPFYNPDNRHDNMVAKTVIENYNQFMDGLVDKGVLEVKQSNEEIQDSVDSVKIKIKYAEDVTKIEKIAIGDWIDLRAAEDVTMKKGEFKLISLGVAMQLPEGYEAHIVPRSSTFKNFGVIQTNHTGIVDNAYCGDNDLWKFPAYALRNTVIHKNDRICQFRIVKNQPPIIFEEVNTLSGKNRGGFGTTGQR